MVEPPEAGGRLERVLAMARNRHMVPRDLVEAQVEKLFAQVPACEARKR